MTVETDTNRINYIITDVGIVDYSFGFKVFDDDHIEVYYDGEAATPGSDFTVALSPDQDLTPGGTVTLTPNPGLGITVTILRYVPHSQLTDYRPYDPFPAETHERALDLSAMGRQQLQDEVDRSLKAGVATPPGVSYELPSPEANRGLYWNENEDGMVNGPTVAEIEADKDAAAASAAEAAASAALAGTHASAAANSAANAATSEVNAAASEAKAQEWAETPEDVEVEPGQYSALHWAAKAAASAAEAEAWAAKFSFYDIQGGALGYIAEDAVISLTPVTRGFSFPAGLTGSVAVCLTAPDGGDAVVSLRKNGVEFGTITFADGSTDGVLASPSGETFVAGDAFDALTAADMFNVEDVSFTLNGAIT